MRRLIKREFISSKSYLELDNLMNLRSKNLRKVENSLVFVVWLDITRAQSPLRKETSKRVCFKILVI